MASFIHPTAIVEDGATLGADVHIGPFCLVGGRAALGDGVRLHSHVVIAGKTTLGARCQVFPFAALGHPPQDVKFEGEANELIIGTDCIIREGVTMNPGTSNGGLVTRVGNHCFFLANSHVAHDCTVGDRVILSNNVMVAGHCQIGDFVIFGGGVGVHQFARIGSHAFIGGLSGIENDVIPFGMALGNRAHLAGLNIVGLRRRGFDKEQIHVLRRAYKQLFWGEGNLKERTAAVEATFANDAHVQEIVSFIRAGGERALVTPRDRDAGEN